jgi:hypothetical protein
MGIYGPGLRVVMDHAQSFFFFFTATNTIRSVVASVD